MMIGVREALEGDNALELPLEAWGLNLQSKLASWHQVPAGSLPSDKTALARLLRLNPKSLRALSAKGALHGWFEASDGRLYHPKVASAVLDALRRQENSRSQTAPAREARAKNREVQKSPGTRLTLDYQSETDDSSGDDRLIIDRLSAGKIRQPTENTTTDISVAEAKKGNRSEQKTRTAALLAQREQKIITPATLLAHALSSEDHDRWKYPRLSDPPQCWAVFSQEFALDKDGVSHPMVFDRFIDGVCKSVCEAARIDAPDWRGDWDAVIRWLHAGVRTNNMVEAIEEIASRPNYTPPAVLRYFDRPVREFHKRFPRGKKEAAWSAY